MAACLKYHSYPPFSAGMGSFFLSINTIFHFVSLFVFGGDVCIYCSIFYRFGVCSGNLIL
jgi:hypothetical protein